ncbi:MAG: leucine--tRNA ligase, partial [Patescibacteria group bacterium]
MTPSEDAKNYDHKAIEQKWQKEWEKKGLYKVKDKVKEKENFFELVEFTYPSGNLHVGHWYAFAVSDIYARYKRMQGFNVLFPMGFDAFGLPAENAAINLGKDPKVWTFEQMDKMRVQLRSMGAMFDWDREIVSCDPSYYKWTQWMFNQFLKNDLVYRASTKVNWCPKDQTILANEQVIDGKCDRCGTEVVQRDQEQWMLRITKYADRLIDDLEPLAWPHAIKEAQKNWIGRSEGAEIDFPIVGQPEHPIKVFTTRPDTIFGATFIAVSAGLAKEWINIGWPAAEDIKSYIEKTLKEQSGVRDFKEKEKTGIYAGFTATNPATKEQIPVWITNYVLNDIGTGAIMAVPADDERDFDFAKKFYLPIKNVVRPTDLPAMAGARTKDFYDKFISGEASYEGYGLLINSDQFNDLTSEDAKEKITEFVGGKMVKTYRLRDWGISRQRYWGTPIPIVYDPEGKAHAVPDEHLPWLLPTDVDHTPDGTAPLARSKELFARTEKIFGKGWKPEVETMDTFVDSSWYFYRYLDNKNKKVFADPKKIASWMPIGLYMGGAEHTTMHLLYSRFWVKALYDLGL